jgi:hypothetical protein
MGTCVAGSGWVLIHVDETCWTVSTLEGTGGSICTWLALTARCVRFGVQVSCTSFANVTTRSACGRVGASFAWGTMSRRIRVGVCRA